MWALLACVKRNLFKHVHFSHTHIKIHTSNTHTNQSKPIMAVNYCAGNSLNTSRSNVKLNNFALYNNNYIKGISTIILSLRTM